VSYFATIVAMIKENVLTTGLGVKKDPYDLTFAKAGANIWENDELFQRFLDGPMSWNGPEVLTDADREYFKKIFDIFQLNFHAVKYYTVSTDAEESFPFFKYARAWSKKIDSGREDHPSFWRYEIQVYLRDEDKGNRFLIAHELCHTFGDVVAEALKITSRSIFVDEENINPVLYEGSQFEITLWNNLMKEGLAILFEPMDTISLDETIMKEAETEGYLEMNVLDFLTKVKSEDKRQPFASPYVILSKHIASSLVAEQITQFASETLSPSLDSPAYWNLSHLLERNKDEQKAFFKKIMNLKVSDFLHSRGKSFTQRKQTVVEPLMIWMDLVRQEEAEKGSP